MDSFYLMKNRIKDYAWGHSSYIPRLLGLDWPDGKPAAEMWMGAHSSATSMILVAGKWIELDGWIADHSILALGAERAERCKGLPYLFKLLAAEKSLSIQVHPDKQIAEEGFRRENQGSVGLHSPKRNYKDDNHKPEMLMALTPFTLMTGFRSPDSIVKNFHPIVQGSMFSGFHEMILRYADYSESEWLTMFYEKIFSLSGSRCDVLIERAVQMVDSVNEWELLQRKWILRLFEQHPSDIGVLAPLFLNVLEIQPGEALFQASKMLHAYLDGIGIELMANSDNVLRGGLSSKHVDIPELMRVLDFRPTVPHVLQSSLWEQQRCSDAFYFFPSPAQEFSLGLGIINEDVCGKACLSHGEGPVIILNLSGEIVLNDFQGNLILERGQSAFIPHGATDVWVGGQGKLVLAGLGS